MKVAIIPARGGSKRVPRKNIIDFEGKPMIAHSIEAAKASGLFERIVVSTDDAEISAVARAYGADVPFVRPCDLADDRVGTNPVIAHAIGWLQQAGVSPSIVCCIYATAPFLRANDLEQGLAKLEAGGWEYVFSAASFGFPIFRGFKQVENGGLEMLFPQHQTTRSQDLPEILHDAGQFYWGRAEAWLNQLQIYERWSSVVLLPRWRVQDIDTLEDLEHARRLYKALAGQL